MLGLLLALELGVIGSIYDGQIKTDFGYQLKVGKDIYAWGSYENPDFAILGQVGDLETWGYGVGVQHSWGKVVGFLEYGIFDPKAEFKPAVQNEVVNRVLMNDHGERPPFRDTSYRLNQGYGGRVGIGYDLSDHFRVSFAYRFLNIDEDIDAWNGPHGFVDDVPFGDWWQERGTLDLSSAEFGISVRF